jgi:soluble lytic murein transglycosylase-like protein
MLQTHVQGISGDLVRQLAICLILTLFFAQPSGAKEVDCVRQGAGVTCRVTGETAATSSKPSAEILQLVARAVRGSETDPRLVLAVIAAESAFDRMAVSRKNAMGLMQLMPETQQRYGVINPFDAAENIRAGTSYLTFLIKKFGNLKLALAAYNAGEGPVLAYGSVPPFDETTGYVDRVLRLYEKYKTARFESIGPPGEPIGAPHSGPKIILSSETCGLICRGHR